MKLARSTLMISASLFAAVAYPTFAHAEEAGADDDVIIVTAQKREQNLIDVPQSISVVGGDQLERLQANNFADYIKNVPGLQLDQSTPGAGRLVMRGLNTGGVASTVGVYVDETPFGSSTALANGGVLAGDFDTFDIARVEVLRGPQGTLYGASTLGGLIKYVTSEPKLGQVEGRARAALEDTKGGEISYHGNAMINLPLGETLALRATGFYHKNGGWIDSIGTSGTSFMTPVTSDIDSNINDSESYGGRASLLFKPNETFDVRLTAYLQNIRADANSSVESDPDTLETLYGRQSQSQFSPEFYNVDYRVYNGTINADLGFATLTSSTSYATQKQKFRDDATFNLSGIVQALLGAPANDFVLNQKVNNRRWTQELRLASNSGGMFEWLVGGYYNNEKAELLQDFAAYTAGTTDPIAFPFVLGHVDLQSKYEEYAGFANGTLHFGEKVDLDFGGRYSHNNQSASQGASGVLAANVPINSDLRSSDDVFTYSVAPKFKFNDRATLYARIAKGYRPGGPNVIAPNAPADTPASFDPDTAVSYELGVKGETANGSFGLELSVFHIDWDNIQLLAAINGFGVNINGSSATSEGAEFTATLRPTKGFTVSVNGAYTDAKLDEDAPPLVGGLEGDQLPFTPKYAVTVNSDYDWDLGGDTKAFVGGSLRFLSKQSGDFDGTYRADNGRQRQLPSYVTVDLRAGVDFGRFGIEAYVRNLTDAEGKTSTGAQIANGLPVNPAGAVMTGVIRPRTIGLSLSAEY